MTAYSSDDDDKKRLLQLSHEVSRIATALANLSVGFAAPPPPSEDVESDEKAPLSVRTVELALHARRARGRYFPGELFAEPAWDMLLNLLLCELRGGRVSKSDLCLAVRVPETTALRWISTMVHKGLVITELDGNDGRASFIALAPHASAALRRYFSEVAEEG